MLYRKVQVKFRLTQAEHFKLVRLAQEAGSSVAAFVRRCTLDSEHVTIIGRDLIRDMYREVNAIGKNINQIAKVANTHRHISSNKIEQLLAWQRELCQLVDKNFGEINTE